MQKQQRTTDKGIKTPLLGFGVLITSVMVFLIFLGIIIVIARVVLGS